jgi:hypothetical protein
MTFIIAVGEAAVLAMQTLSLVIMQHCRSVAVLCQIICSNRAALLYYVDVLKWLFLKWCTSLTWCL